MPQKIKVDTALMPAFCRDFHCLASACQDTCCAGWRIEFNKKDYLAIKRAARSEELKERLTQGMPRLRERSYGDMYAEFSMNSAGACHLLREDGLCALQTECGPEVLPVVCRTFPRKECYTPCARELSLTPACEGVINLLWDLPQGIDFVQEPLRPEDVRFCTPRNAASARFTPIRSLCIDLLQQRALPLSRRLLLLGLLFQQLQPLDWEDGAALDTWTARSEALIQDPSAASLTALSPSLKLFLANNLHILLSAFNGNQKDLALRDELLAALNEDWQNQDLDHFLVQCDSYRSLEARLEELLDHSESFFENLTVALAFYLRFPYLDTPEALWRSYVSLCSLYSFFRFAAVCACEREVSRARVTHVLVQASRVLIHNRDHQAELRDELFKNDSATLAHMAILLGD